MYPQLSLVLSYPDLTNVYTLYRQRQLVQYLVYFFFFCSLYTIASYADNHYYIL
jgi:hypothetical protein